MSLVFMPQRHLLRLISYSFLLAIDLLCAKEDPPDEPMPESSDAKAVAVVEAYLEAIGGRKALGKIDSLVLEGTLTEGRNQYDFTFYRKTPDRGRHERLLQARYGEEIKIITGFDGEQAWTWDQSGDYPYPDIMEGKPAALFRRKCPIFGPFFRPGLEPVIFSFEGEKTYRGIPVKMIRAWYGDGDYEWYYFHRDNGLLLLKASREIFAGTPTFIDEVFTKYDQVADVYFPVRSVRRVRDQKIGSREITSVQPNPNLPHSLFTKPKSKERWLRQAN